VPSIFAGRVIRRNGTVRVTVSPNHCLTTSFFSPFSLKD
jgi:hypothetical protein